MRWRYLLVLFCSGVLLAQCSNSAVPGTAADQAQPQKPGRQDEMRLSGELVAGGAECQRFRSTGGKFYTLEGNLRGFRTGDRVEVTGFVPRASHCMQDTPFRVTAIRRIAKTTAEYRN